MSRSRTGVAKQFKEAKSMQLESKSGKRLMPVSIVCLLSVLIFIVWASTGQAQTGNAQLSSAQPSSAQSNSAQPSSAKIRSRLNTQFTASLSNYSIIQTYPHDPNAFTQGLEYDQVCNSTEASSCQDIFWESTGLYGQSTIREVDVVTGQVIRQQALPASDFGEGLVKFGTRLFQLTWLSGKTYFYDVTNFANSTMQNDPLRDGWGATTDGRNLIVSDGSTNIYYLDPETLQVVKSLAVNDNGKPVPMLNELEYINDEIWANVWMTECIAKIDPYSGKVRGWVVFSGLRNELLAQSPPQALPIDVLNGIAYDSTNQRLFITGKCWPKMYEVKTQITKLQMSPTEHLQVQQMCGVSL